MSHTAFELAVTLVPICLAITVPIGISIAIILAPMRTSLSKPNGPPPVPVRGPALAAGGTA